MRKQTLMTIVLFLGLLTNASGQLTQEQFTLNDKGQYHFSKAIELPDATETDIIGKTKKFLKEYTEHLEGTTWQQVKGKNVVEASVEIKSPRLLIINITISAVKGKYTYDIKGIEFFYRETWWPAETVLGNTKADFNEIRTELLEGATKLCNDIENGIK